MHTVLILEDEADIRELIAITLSSSQIRCELCSHVGDALSVLKQRKPDFVLTDLQLPDGSGLDLLRESRARYPDVAVAVITAYADTDSAIEALRCGALDYLKKPIDTAALRALVQQALAQQSASPTDPTPSNELATKNTGTESSEEHSELRDALEKHRWNKRATAEALGLSYRQLRYRISKLGLD